MPWGTVGWEPAEGEAGAELPRGAAEAFAASMPPRYAVLFDPRTVRRHALVVHRRAERPAHAELWRAMPDGSGALCVVADDRPGLLSTIAAALVWHGLDVTTALVFSRRRPDGVMEAVDLFWVRRANAGDVAPIDPGEATSISEVVSALLAGRVAVEDLASDAGRGPSGAAASITVRFDEDDEDGLAVLVIEAGDRPGILLAISRELFRQGAQIVRSLVRTAGGRAFNRFELAEQSGAPLTAERREQIREAVLGVIALARHA